MPTTASISAHAGEHTHQPHRESRLRRLSARPARPSSRRCRPGSTDRPRESPRERSRPATTAAPWCAARCRPASCDRRTAGRCPDRRSGCRGRPRYFTSPTTPTIDIQGLLDVSEPNLIRLPIGSCPGQNRLTTRSLTIDRRRRRRHLRVGERPAADDRDAQRAEEIRRHPVHVDARHVLRVDRRLAFGGVERRAAVAVERQVVAERRRGDAGHRAQPIEQRRARRRPAAAAGGCAGGAGRGRRRRRPRNADVQRQHRLRIEAGVRAPRDCGPNGSSDPRRPAARPPATAPRRRARCEGAAIGGRRCRAPIP